CSSRIDFSKRRFHECFCFRARHQRRRINAQRQAPEFLEADNARDGLVHQPALREAGDRVPIAGGKDTRACRRQPGVIEGEGVTNKDAGVEVWRFDSSRAEPFRQEPTRGAYGESFRLRRREGGGAGGTCHRASSAASCAACCSATSASIISPSASPPMISGSL